ncbi:hypothetical protein [Dactylosporangium sp. CA-233914]|uniref:hypothetical protein n=1 Tax=Dactylosporangium sp. CA-233914 TaxID=3239934 RepID=UPI003D93742A
MIGRRGGAGAADVGEVLRLLAEREAACRAEVDRLQAEVDRIGGLLVVCRQELDRVVTARGVVGELGVTDLAVAAPAGRAVVVASGADAESFTDRVLAVLAGHGGPVRCREVVAALGEDASVARHVERVRHRLKKLHQAGQVAEITPGMFTLARAGGPARG